MRPFVVVKEDLPFLVVCDSVAMLSCPDARIILASHITKVDTNDPGEWLYSCFEVAYEGVLYNARSVHLGDSVGGELICIYDRFIELLEPIQQPGEPCYPGGLYKKYAPVVSRRTILSRPVY